MGLAPRLQVPVAGPEVVQSTILRRQVELDRPGRESSLETLNRLESSFEPGPYMALLDFVVAAYAPWLLVFSLHVWIFQSIEDDRENAHRRLTQDIKDYVRGELGGGEASDKQKRVWQETRDDINANAKMCTRTFFAQLIVLTLGILAILSTAEILPVLAIALFVASVFAVMVVLLSIAVKQRHRIRSVSLGV